MTYVVSESLLETRVEIIFFPVRCLTIQDPGIILQWPLLLNLALTRGLCYSGKLFEQTGGSHGLYTAA